MQPTVQESVPDVLNMVYLQQHIAGLQQLQQPVRLPVYQRAPIVAKQKHFQHLDTVIQVHTNQVLMQHIVQESVQDVLPTVYLQQPIVGLQQPRQHVQLPEHQHVLTVAKPRVFLH